MPKPYFHDKNIALEEILRVNHAGEYGAVRIYQGQIAALKGRRTNTDEIRLLTHMLEQEKTHLKYFESCLSNGDSNPTFFLPLWHVGGYFMGKASMLAGPKTAMLCTEAVEDVINEHYLSQKQILCDIDEEELANKVEQFRLEELEHQTLAIQNGSKEAPIYNIVKNMISGVCKVAIWMSKAL